MIAIVTDSSACLYKAEADRLGVTVVPMSYSCLLYTSDAADD